MYRIWIDFNKNSFDILRIGFDFFWSLVDLFGNAFDIDRNEFDIDRNEFDSHFCLFWGLNDVLACVM